MSFLSKILKSARDKPTSLALILMYDGLLLGAATANYHRFGFEGLLWAIAGVVPVTVGALYLRFGSGNESWPKQD